MADLANKKNPLDLREERPDYVEDKSGMPLEEAEGDDVQPHINAGPQDPGDLSKHKEVVHLDKEKVKRAEEQGRGM